MSVLNEFSKKFFIYANSKILMQELTNQFGEYVYPVVKPSVNIDKTRVYMKKIELTNDCTEEIINDMIQFAQYLYNEITLLDLKMLYFYFAEIDVSVVDTTQPPRITVSVFGLFEPL